MRKTLTVLVLLSAVGLLAYSNSFNVPFQFDGLGQIAGNPMIKSLKNFAPVIDVHAPHPPPGSVYNNRRLVGYLTLALNYRFGGLDVTGYHVVNLAVHVMSGFLVYLLIILTFKTPYFSRQPSAVSNQQEAGHGGRLRHNDSLFTIHISPPFRDSRFLLALFAALLFVVHPLQTQAVTYIVQRFTSLAAMFYLLSIVFFIKGRLSSRKAGKLASLFLSLLCAVLAMLTKETSFTLPIIIVFYEFFFFKSPLRKKLLFLSPVLLTLVIIPISVMGTHKPLGELLSDLSARTRVQTNIPRWDYLMTQMRVITTYIRLLFLPVNQNLDYDYPVYHSLSQPPVALSALFLLSIIGMAGYLSYRSRREAIGKRQWARRTGKPASLQADESVTDSGRSSYSFPPHRGGRAPSPASPPVKGGAISECPTSNLQPATCRYYRLIAFGIFWFFITLSVESSVIPIADVIFEHRVYLPSVGAFIAISSAAFMVAEKLGGPIRAGKVLVSVLSAVIILLLAGATYARNAVWRDPVGLWQDVLRKSPGNARAYNDLGYLYLTRGQTDKSIGYFRSALKIRPYYSNAYTNLGVAYYAMGWTDEAIAQFKRALALEPYGPDVAEDHHNLGIAFTKKGMLDEAISEYTAALKLDPGNAGIYSDMGVAYRQQGMTGKAIECFRKALDLDPGYVYAHLNLAGAYEAEGRHDEARREYYMARRLERTKGDSPF